MDDVNWEPELEGNDVSDSPVERLSVSDTDYYEPTEDLASRFSTRRFGMTAVVIPKGRRDGRSAAFDPGEAHAVCVDPDDSGGVVVDLRRVNRTIMRKALNMTNKPSEVYRYLQKMTDEDAQPRQRKSKRLRTQDEVEADQAVTPKNSSMLEVFDEAPPVVTPPPVIRQPHYNGQNMAQPTQFQQLPFPPNFVPPPASPSPDVMAILAQMGQMTAVVSSLADRLNTLETTKRSETKERTVTLPPPKQKKKRRLSIEDTATRPLKAGSIKRRQLVEADEDDEKPTLTRPKYRTKKRRSHTEEEQERPRKRGLRGAMMEEEPKKKDKQNVRGGQLVGFEVLDIPFIVGTIPEKARCRVYFEYPQMGRQVASYHAVVNDDNLIALVYDTRYEEGTQFEPPNLGTEQGIIVHLEGPKKEKLSYPVRSIGLTFQLGVLEFIILLKERNDNLPPDLTESEEFLNQAIRNKVRDVEFLRDSN